MYGSGLLEEYCECLYQLYISLLGEESVPSLERTWNELGKALAAVQNSVDQDIPERLEAVFLPYKEAMWDSIGNDLESGRCGSGL